MTDFSSSDTDGESAGPSSKKPKLTKMRGAAAYRTKFNKEWMQKYLFIREVRGDAYSFLCTICERQVSCSHQGKRDVELHIGKAMHQANVKAKKLQSTLPFRAMSSGLTEKVT